MHTEARHVRAIKIELRATMQIAVSLCLLGAALFAILSDRYDANTKHWAFATAGTILGFWLRR
jgi:hypothetical protein